MARSTDQSVWLTREEMKELCPSCYDEMVEKKMTKVKVMNSDGEFVNILKAGFSQGLCDKFGGATGFRTRCMASSLADQVSDVGAFCNSLKIYCHGSAGAEGKRAKIVAKDEKRRFTLGIVYEPDVADTDDEYAKAEDIEKAAWDFMREIQGRSEMAKLSMQLVEMMMKAGGEEDIDVEVDVSELCEEIAKRGVSNMHVEDIDDADIVESFIAPVDMEIAGQKVSKGSWLVGIVWSPEHFKKIEDGDWQGYSMGGWARKVKEGSL